MSEYQYYEFQSVDRPLTSKQMEELRRVSSRADITPNSLTNVYNYGDFRGDPDKLMNNYFDAFLYLANWGTRWLMFRVPRKMLDFDSVAAFTGGDCFSCRKQGDHVILSFHSENEEYEWAEGGGWLSALLPIRELLIRGDYRALYLGWLLAIQCEEADMDSMEPEMPPGLAKLDEPLRQFANFLRIDTDLIAVAAKLSASQPSSHLSKGVVTTWLSKLSTKKKDALLADLILDEEPNLVIELQRQALRSTDGVGPPRSEPRRTAAELLERAHARYDARRAREAKKRAQEEARREQEAVQKRRRKLRSLKGKESKLWSQIQDLIEMRQAKFYDSAIGLLQDLHDLAEMQGTMVNFQKKMSALCDEHPKKTALLARFRKANFI